EAVHAKQIAQWKQDLPILDQSLDLIVRDQSLADTIGEIAQPAGVSFDITDGSYADVETLLGVDELRVSFLDLRNATLAEALDWITQPNRLSWWVADGQIHIATDRRRTGDRAWVYDVSAIAWPQEGELPAEKPAEQPEPAEALQEDGEEEQPPLSPLGQSLQSFATTVQAHLGEKAKTVAWIDDGQLVVIADAATHEKVASLFMQLADPDATFDGDLAELHKKT